MTVQTATSYQVGPTRAATRARAGGAEGSVGVETSPRRICVKPEIDRHVGDEVDLDVRQPRVVVAQLGANLHQRFGSVGRIVRGLLYDRVLHRSHDG